MNIYTQRVQDLRTEMKKYNIDAYLILTSDPHLSEYVPEFWKNRQWISGFSGSAGSILITQEYAALWADGRYWLQAQKELEGSNIELQKQDSHNTYIQWLKDNFVENGVLATDYKVLPLFIKKDIESQLQHKNIQLHNKDLISHIWTERPLLPTDLVYEHTLSPHTRTEKLEAIRKNMQENNASFHLVSTLDDIAWICNLRGSDVPYNPVFLSHLFLSHNKAILFVDEKKISDDIAIKLKNDGFSIKAYDDIESSLKELTNETIMIDPTKTTAHLVGILESQNKIIEDINPSHMLKACKSDAELAQIQEAMVQDGVALCNFFAWFEDALKDNKQISELDIDMKLTEFRSKDKHYISDSFATIAGFNGNGAQPHYRATEEEFSYIDTDGFLLIDSGGQYSNGTTDITRVVPIGQISNEQKRDYTLVLKAHIALSSTIFPCDIAMPLLDAITRAPLWKEQIDYMHGTGHGVGYFLNVHEGPQVISYFAPPLPKTKAKAGMISSIEPGIYRAKQWGVRLENLVVNALVQQPKEKQFGTFLYFEPLTLCPFEVSCVDLSLLNDSEKQWLNNYHAKVQHELEPKLKGRAKEWLLQRTKPVG